ncbi:MEGF10_11 [Mytilus coruscus]|uniref:MEGF10_11 n=1 Tax=Mytilus coruscus TaxID=42192 RepID=A0A6J8A497_MYTCO|nr:MEGF10_11 [Mytilus coruscus]
MGNILFDYHSGDIFNFLTWRSIKCLYCEIRNLLFQRIRGILHVMLHTTNIFCTFTLILCITSFGVSTDTQGSGIVYTADKRICQNITWKLVNDSVYFNVSGVLKTGDGKERNVHGEVPTSGSFNITTSKTEICCPGFFKNHKGRCKRCRNKTYGLDCLNKCNCTDVQKCDRRTGECKKCKKNCEDDDGGDDDDDDKSTISTHDYSTTPRPQSTGKSSAPSTVIGATEADNGIEYNISTVYPCGICKQFGNCSNEHGCAFLSAGHEGTVEEGLGKGHTILIAVVLSLAILTILLITCIVLRERNHRKQKQKIKESALVKFSCSDETTEYVDPEPVYSEIKEEEIGLRNGNCYTPNLPDRPVNHEYYKLPETDENIETDECGYLNPYTALRFARSESNLFRDRDLRDKGTYDVTYSLAKAIQRDDNSSAEEHGDLDKLVYDSSQKDERSSDVPVYFVLEKNDKQTESHDNPEREKLLKRESKSRSSI